MCLNSCVAGGNQQHIFLCFFQTLQLHMINFWPEKKTKNAPRRWGVSAAAAACPPSSGSSWCPHPWYCASESPTVPRRMTGDGTHSSHGMPWGDMTWGWLVGISWQGLPRNSFLMGWNQWDPSLRMSAAEWQEQHLGGMVLEVCYGIFVAKP